MHSKGHAGKGKSERSTTMKSIDLNEFIVDVHKNAVAHGWWDDNRTFAELRSLLHCELSEAMESYRKNEQLVWHKCPFVTASCEHVDIVAGGTDCKTCTPAMRKPEGIAVELIDFCIRVMDWMGRYELGFAEKLKDPASLIAFCVDDFQDDEITDILNVSLPALVDVLHDHITMSRMMQSNIYLIKAVGIALAWIEHQGLDPVHLMQEKHEYNKGRSYRHGNKRC
jgi:hypothetical protein